MVSNDEEQNIDDTEPDETEPDTPDETEPVEPEYVSEKPVLAEAVQTMSVLDLAKGLANGEISRADGRKWLENLD